MDNEAPDDKRRLLLKTLGLGAALSILPRWANAQPRFTAAPALLKPPRLNKGDTIALTAPAGAIFTPEKIDTVEQQLKGLGYAVKRGATLTAKRGYFAGDDQLRADELNSFFKDEAVKLIIAMRGGWGCARLLPLLDFDAMRNHPKILSGFSDVTTLLLAQYVKTGLVGLHGIMGNSSMGDFTMNNFLGIAAEGKTPAYTQPTDQAITTFGAGTAEGVLLGGNLTVLCSLIGSDYLPDFTGAILFIEETEEEPYSIDRMLTQLKLAGILGQLSGIIFGQCTKCDAEEPDKSLTLLEVLTDHLKPLGIPAFSGSMIGHVKDKFTIPIGIRAKMDASTGSITLLDSAVI